MLEVCEKAYRLFVVTLKICQMLQISFYRLVLQLQFIVTVDVLYDQEESDFVRQCQTKLWAFASRIRSEFKQIERRIVHQNALWSLVFSTTRP